MVAGVNLEVRDGQQRTAMHLAAMHGHAAVLQQLAAAGADPSPLDQDQKTPLHLAVEAGREEAAAALVAVGGMVDPAAAAKCNLLHAAIRTGDGRLSITLIRAGAAVRADDWQDGHSLLHVAAAQGCVSAVEVLIAAGLPVDVRNSCGCTPLHIAAERKGSTAGAASIAAATDPFHMQTELGHPDVGSPSPRGGMQSGEVEGVVKALLAAGADLEARDMHCRTAMHHAAKYGQVQVLQQLAAAGAAVYPLDATGYTPLHVAMQEKQAGSAAAFQAIGGWPDPEEAAKWSQDVSPIDAGFYVDVLQHMIARVAEEGAPDQASKQLASAFASKGVFMPMLEKALEDAAAADGLQRSAKTIMQHAVLWATHRCWSCSF